MPDIADPAVTSAPAEAPEPPVRGRRRGRWLLLLVLLGGGLWGLPWIVGSTPLRESVTYQVMPWLPPGAKFDSPSLGWMSPVHLSKVRILDNEGQLLVECDHVTSEKTLWEMATHPRSPGGWILEKPRMTLRIGPDGTNLDSIVANALRGRRGSKLLDLRISITEGRIDMIDPEEQPLAVLEDVNLGYTNLPGGGEVDGGGRLTAPENAGDIAVKGEWSTPADGQALPTVQFDVALRDWPAGLLEPIVASHSTIEDLSGRFTTTLTAHVSPTPDQSAEVQGELRVAPVTLEYRRKGSAATEVLSPREIVARVDGTWNRESDLITLSQFRFDADTVTLTGAGTIAEARGAAVVSFKGDANRDLSGFLELLPGDWRKHVQISGLTLREWAVAGALRPERLAEPSPGMTFGGNIAWEHAAMFGIESPAGVITAAYDGERVAFTPQNVTVSGGQLAQLPEVVLAEPRSLVAEKGPMLVDVAFTEEQCRGWMKYLSPVLANATSATGNFTLEVESGEMPLADREKATATGILHVHSAQIGPGPAARKVLESAATLTQLVTQKPPAWAQKEVQLELPQQDIAFRVENGRVFHSDLTFRIGDLTVLSSGWVGFDDTLEVNFAMRLPDEWLNRGPVLQSLKGEVITVTVEGTLDNPRVDGRSLAEFGKRIGARAAGGLLQNLLEKQLDKAAERAARRRGVEPTP